MTSKKLQSKQNYSGDQEWVSSSNDNETYYRKITDNTPVIIWITNKEGNCTYLNKQWYKYTGQAPGTGLGHEWLDAVHPDDRKWSEDILLKAYQNHLPFSFEFQLKGRDGHYRWHIDSALPRFDEQQNFLGFVGSVIDIHERKQKEDALRRSEAWYKTYAEAMPQMAFIADAKGNIIYYNQRWYEYIGGMVGTEGWGWKEKPIHHPDDLQRSINTWSKSLHTGNPYEMEYRLRRFDGEFRWHLGRAMPIRDKDGNIELWLGTNTDIHKQKQTEASLKETEERFELITKATNDAVWDWDLLTNKLWWNQTAFTIFGFKHDEIGPDISWWDEHIHHDDRQRVVEGLRQVIDGGGNSWSDEYRFICADGSFAEILDRGYIIRNEFKKPVRMVGSMLDISERKRSEEALMLEREKLQAIIENMGVGVGVTDPIGTTLSLNKAALKIHGFQEESEMLAQIERNREMFELQYPDGKEMPFEQWPSMRVINGERVNNYEVKLINRTNQSHKYISYTAVPIYDSNRMLQNFIFTLTDLTEQKETEEKLNFQKSLLEAQQEVSPLGNLVVSPDGKMLTFNRRMIEMWHLSDEIMSSKIDDKALQNAKEQLKDPDAFIEKVIECYQKHIHNHEKLYFKDGRIFDRYGAPVNDGSGNYYGYVWYFMDITEQENLARQKDDFLGIASHELKTPVAIMKGYINMVERLLGNKDLTMEAGLLKKADIQIIRLTNLINDLLDVTKIESGKMQFERKEFEFDLAVEDVVESMQHITSHRLVQSGKTGIKIMGDKERTGQVIANFISNAVKYSPKSTEIIIDTWSEENEVFFQIKDHGIGISKEDLPKVFDRFFRVRGSGNHSAGLGLGLYISSEIIKRQNGKIWAESKEGEGSIFGFSLPIN